jgi:hypothetical protein
MTPDDLRNRFAYHAPDDEKRKAHERVRELLHDTAAEINDLVPAGREQSLAVTHLEDAMMWANAGIARA